MKYSELFEGRDAPLYHWMDSGKTINTFNSDTLEARVTHPIPGMGDVKGISMSRNERFDFGRGGSVRLTIDQAKLAERFKIIPLDGEAAFRRHHGMEATVTDRSNNNRQGWVFSEEYVVGGNITQLHRYITEILIFRWDEMYQAYAEKWYIPFILSRQKIVVKR